jgi:hypothetical protein
LEPWVLLPLYIGLVAAHAPLLLDVAAPQQCGVGVGGGQWMLAAPCKTRLGSA